jgi:hypothetical protein
MKYRLLIEPRQGPGNAAGRQMNSPACQRRPCRPSLSLVIVGCAMVLALAGCSPKVKSAALGKWQVKDSKEAMEFRSDGTCQGSDSDGRVVSGTFAFLDADHIKVDLTTTAEDKAKGLRFVDHASGVAKIVVQGDTLTMTEENGSAKHYQRAK